MPVYTGEDGHVKVEQYFAEAESAIILYSGQITTFKGRVSYFYRTQVNLGSDLWVRMSVCHRRFAMRLAMFLLDIIYSGKIGEMGKWVVFRFLRRRKN